MKVVSVTEVISGGTYCPYDNQYQPEFVTITLWQDEKGFIYCDNNN